MYAKCLLPAACVVMTASIMGAQETTTGSIAGRVVDAQGLVIPGATVTVNTPQGPRTFTTDSDGAFFAHRPRRAREAKRIHDPTADVLLLSPRATRPSA